MEKYEIVEEGRVYFVTLDTSSFVEVFEEGQKIARDELSFDFKTFLNYRTFFPSNFLFFCSGEYLRVLLFSEEEMLVIDLSSGEILKSWQVNTDYPAVRFCEKNSSLIEILFRDKDITWRLDKNNFEIKSICEDPVQWCKKGEIVCRERKLEFNFDKPFFHDSCAKYDIPEVNLNSIVVPAFKKSLEEGLIEHVLYFFNIELGLVKELTEQLANVSIPGDSFGWKANGNFWAVSNEENNQLVYQEVNLESMQVFSLKIDEPPGTRFVFLDKLDGLLSSSGKMHSIRQGNGVGREL